MNLINNEIFGEGYYYLDSNKNLTFIEKEYKRIAKKIEKRNYVNLTVEQLDELLKTNFKSFLKSLEKYTITFINTNNTITNIVYLWYENGFCHYKLFENGKLKSFTTNDTIIVNTHIKKIDLYPIIKHVEYYTFGDAIFGDKTIYDLEKMYELYYDENF